MVENTRVTLMVENTRVNIVLDYIGSVHTEHQYLHTTIIVFNTNPNIFFFIIKKINVRVGVETSKNYFPQCIV